MDAFTVPTNTLRAMTRKVRTQALATGWPPRLVARLTVTWDDESSLSIQYPEQYADEILALEYGTSETPPTSVIRKMSAVLLEELEDELTVSALAML